MRHSTPGQRPPAMREPTTTNRVSRIKMLKTIAPSQVELGMFVHKLEGSWLKHPFWKSRFLLEDPQTLADLRDADIRGVVIDISKGRDVAPVQPQVRRVFTPPIPGATTARRPARARSRPAASRRPASARRATPTIRSGAAPRPSSPPTARAGWSPSRRAAAGSRR